MNHSKFFKLPAVLTFCTLMSLTSITATASDSIKMSVFEGYKSSEAVLHGDYLKAIELAKLGLESKSMYKRTVQATTLCVAYTKTGKFDLAETYCDAAIENSQKSATLRRAADAYSDDNSSPVSIIQITEINKSVLEMLAVGKEISASI